jgi:hypothetical protein
MRSIAEHMTVENGILACNSHGLEIPLLDMRKKTISTEAV